MEGFVRLQDIDEWATCIDDINLCSYTGTNQSSVSPNYVCSLEPNDGKGWHQGERQKRI